jgi:protein-S-isoprenylcysteine O-methyltransferase Ste14
MNAVKHLPTIIISLTIWTYWSCVLVMAVRARMRGRGSVLSPRKPLERMIWPVWVAVVVGWNVLPSLPWNINHWLIKLPEAVHGQPFFIVRTMLALLGTLCLLVTMRCWWEMGRSWGVASDPGVKTDLITTGLYNFVLHPIYALSVTLMTLTALVAPSPSMIAVAAIHVLFMNIKAHSEEQELARIHGDEYRRYQSRTGRFVPRLSAPETGSSQRAA